MSICISPRVILHNKILGILHLLRNTAELLRAWRRRPLPVLLYLSNASLLSSYGKIIWIECLKPVNNPHPGKSRTIAFLPPWALVLVASRAQDDASFLHTLEVAFSSKKRWRTLGTQTTGRHFFCLRCSRFSHSHFKDFKGNWTLGSSRPLKQS